MKEIKTITEYQELGKERPAILEFGMAEGCIPCKLTKENLTNLEKIIHLMQIITFAVILI